MTKLEFLNLIEKQIQENILLIIENYKYLNYCSFFENNGTPLQADMLQENIAKNRQKIINALYKDKKIVKVKEYGAVKKLNPENDCHSFILKCFPQLANKC